MVKELNTRKSTDKDVEAIRLLHEEAFAEPEGKVVAQLACDMLADKTAEPLLSLVVEDNSTIVGHIIFSPVVIQGEENVSIYILAPLAISKGKQRQGLGTKLIHLGFDELRKRGVAIVLVYGDPEYYGRIGFKAGHNIKAPYPLEYPDAWMALEIRAGMLDKLKGIAQCCASLSSPEYW